MSHKESRDFFLSVSKQFPRYFTKGNRVLDIGSLDINGSNRYLFEQCDEYIGIDVAPGKNVTKVCLAHEYDEPDNSFDVIISSDCFEHDMFWQKTFVNIVRLLKSDGLFCFSCKTTGGGEHGTLNSDGGFASPLTVEIPGWENYYRNITEEDYRSVVNVENTYKEYKFESLKKPADLRFYGVKK